MRIELYADHTAAGPISAPNRRVLPVLDTLYAILNADMFTYAVVTVLTTWAGTLFRHMSGSTALTTLFLPSVWLGAMAGIFYCREFGVIFTSDKDSNVVVASGVGMILGLVGMLVVTRLVYVLTRRRAAVQRPDLKGI